MTRCRDCVNFVAEKDDNGRCFGQPVKANMSSRNCPRDAFKSCK